MSILCYDIFGWLPKIADCLLLLFQCPLSRRDDWTEINYINWQFAVPTMFRISSVPSMWCEQAFRFSFPAPCWERFVWSGTKNRNSINLCDNFGQILAAIVLQYATYSRLRRQGNWALLPASIPRRSSFTYSEYSWNGVLQATNQQCQSTEGNTKHYPYNQWPVLILSSSTTELLTYGALLPLRRFSYVDTIH